MRWPDLTTFLWSNNETENQAITPSIKQFAFEDQTTCFNLLADLKKISIEFLNGKTAKNILGFLHLPTNTGLTLGLAIALHQKNNKWLKENPAYDYSQLLRTLLKEKVNPRTIYALLTLQDDAGWSYGAAVAYLQTEEAGIDYLDLLYDLHLQGIKTDEILALLWLGSDRLTSNMGVAAALQQKNQLVQKYVWLLNNLQKDTGKINAIIDLLSFVNKTNHHFTGEVANLNEETMLVYLDFLDKLLPLGAVDKILTLFMQADLAENILGTKLIQAHKQKALQQYFLLLMHTLACGAHPETLFQLIINPSRRGQNFLIDAAYHASPNCIIYFMDLLSRLLLHNTLFTQKWLQLRNIHDKDDLNFASILMRRKDWPSIVHLLAQSSAIIIVIQLLQQNKRAAKSAKPEWLPPLSNTQLQAYLYHLQKLYHLGFPYHELFTLLMTKYEDGKRLLTTIAKASDEVIADYLTWLTLLAADQVDIKAIQNLFSLQEESFVDVLLIHHKIKFLYELIANRFLSETEIHKLINKKEMIVDFILTMDIKITTFFKKNALRDALDRSHPLGQFLNLNVTPAEKNIVEIKEKIINELERLEQTDKKYWKMTLFGNTFANQIDDRDFILHDPYETYPKDDEEVEDVMRTRMGVN